MDHRLLLHQYGDDSWIYSFSQPAATATLLSDISPSVWTVYPVGCDAKPVTAVQASESTLTMMCCSYTSAESYVTLLCWHHLMRYITCICFWSLVISLIHMPLDFGNFVLVRLPACAEMPPSVLIAAYSFLALTLQSHLWHFQHFIGCRMQIPVRVNFKVTVMAFCVVPLYLYQLVHLADCQATFTDIRQHHSCCKSQHTALQPFVSSHCRNSLPLEVQSLHPLSGTPYHWKSSHCIHYQELLTTGSPVIGFNFCLSSTFKDRTCSLTLFCSVYLSDCAVMVIVIVVVIDINTHLHSKTDVMPCVHSYVIPHFLVLQLNSCICTVVVTIWRHLLYILNVASQKSAFLYSLEQIQLFPATTCECSEWHCHQIWPWINS